MIDMNFADYVDKGLGVVSFLLIVAIVVYYVLKIEPLMKARNAQDARMEEIVRNNNTVIAELSRSNDNVAVALTLLQSTIESNTKSLEEHDARTGKMEIEVIKLSERTKACLSRSQGI